MTAVGESDSSLANKCLDLCQTLASQGKDFNFSISIGSAFSLSLNSRELVPALDTKSKTTAKKKMPSPSTIRRNARRRQEFLNKKPKPAAEPSASARPLKVHPSPATLSERRQVVSLGRNPAMPSFSQLDGTASPPPPSGPLACTPPPFERPCMGTLDDDEHFCKRSMAPESAACFETNCDHCTRHLCSHHYKVEKCNVNCGFHHCHKKMPGSDMVWGFSDKDCKHKSHLDCSQCHCPDIECQQSPYC